MSIRTARPFTLIELLVVVSIIAVLAAMLLPSLGKARAIAQKTSCMNTQKQIVTALRMYADDMTDQGFPWVHETQAKGCKYEWIYSLEQGKYLQDDTQFFCTAAADTWYYANVATWDFNSGMNVPNAQRRLPLMQYTARARGMNYLGSSGGYNSGSVFGYVAPVQVDYYVTGINVSQNATNWENVPSDQAEGRMPILSCPNVGTTPPTPVPPNGSYTVVYGTWSVRNAHLSSLAMNYANTDGSAITVTMPGGSQSTLQAGVLTPMYKRIWSVR